MTLGASNVAVQLSAGSASASLTGGSGDSGALTISTTTGVTGTVAGTLALEGVPWLGLGGDVTLTIDTSASNFELKGTGHVRVAGLLDLAGELTVTRTSSQVTVAVKAADPTKVNKVTIADDGSYSFVIEELPLSLPIAALGVTLSGKAAVSGGTGAGFTMTVTDAKLVTPAGVVAGTLTITRVGEVLDVTGTGSPSSSATAAVHGDADDLGVLSRSPRSRPGCSPPAPSSSGSGGLAVVGVDRVSFGGTVDVAYNPTDGDVTLGSGPSVSARTTLVGG